MEEEAYKVYEVCVMCAYGCQGEHKWWVTICMPRTYSAIGFIDLQIINQIWFNFSKYRIIQLEKAPS
jgi:hypothetical protein